MYAIRSYYEFFHKKAMEKSNKADVGLSLYRSEISKADVLWFYSHITNNETVTKIILENAEKNNIPLSLAFALAHEESRYQVVITSYSIHYTKLYEPSFM